MNELVGAGGLSRHIDEAQMAKSEYTKVTVRQNIDRQIAAHQAKITELEAAKENLGPAILDLRIDLLQQAMRY